MTDWPALLDALDEGLAAVPPVLLELEQVAAGVGPLPPHLAQRAEAMLRRMADVEASLDHDRAELARELAALSERKSSALQPGTPPVPNFLDTKA